MRVAVIAGGDPGHVFPAAGLTRALAARGHEALLSCGGQWQAALARDGIPGIAMPHPPENREPDAVKRLRQTSRRLAPAIAESLAEHQPDLIVSDVMTPSGGLVARSLGVPWIELVPHPLQDPSPHLPPSGSGFAPAKGRIGRYRDERLYRITKAQWDKGHGENYYAPIGRIIAAHPALELARADWPRDSFLVGPLEWDPADVDLAPPPGDGPLVLLSATTVTGAVTGLAKAALEGLEGTGVRVAWTVLTPPETGLPHWVSAGPGRQAPLIEQARLVVCGGGHGILAKALGRGKPVVCVPGGGEQRENADRVRRAELGVPVYPWWMSARLLRRAVRKVLEEPVFSRNAQAAALDPAARSSGDRAVDVVERLYRAVPS